MESKQPSRARFGRIVVLAAVLVAGCGGGGGGGISCEPGPTISSTPPTVATVGVQYTYVVTGQYLCGLALCFSIEGVNLPSDATVINASAKYVLWTPTADDAGRDVSFSIATPPDSCGDRATQSWTVHVYAAPTIASFGASPAQAQLGQAVQLTAEFGGGSAAVDALGAIQSGEPLGSGPLLRGTFLTLTVTNAAGQSAHRSLWVPMTGPGTFRPTRGQPPLAAVHGPSALLLADGRVFVAGVVAPGGGSHVLGATLLFDPATETFTAGPSPIEARSQPGIAQLRDGRVLLVGGYAPDGSRLLSAELWDPATDTMSPAGTLPAADAVLPAAVTLADGRVLVVHGGAGQGAELYDPRTGAFSAAAPLESVQGRVGVEPLGDGSDQVLIVSEGPATPAEIFRPASNDFAYTGAPGHQRRDFSTARLDDGRVLISGGELAGSGVLPAELYDPGTRLFRDTGMPNYRAGAAGRAVVLLDGSVLVVGGDAERYDPASGRFEVTGAPALPRDGSQSLVRLGDGRVLVFGGCGAACSLAGQELDAELYTP